MRYSRAGRTLWPRRGPSTRRAALFRLRSAVALVVDVLRDAQGARRRVVVERIDAAARLDRRSAPRLGARLPPAPPRSRAAFETPRRACRGSAAALSRSPSRQTQPRARASPPRRRASVAAAGSGAAAAVSLCCLRRFRSASARLARSASAARSRSRRSLISAWRPRREQRPTEAP